MARRAVVRLLVVLIAMVSMTIAPVVRWPAAHGEELTVPREAPRVELATAGVP